MSLATTKWTGFVMALMLPAAQAAAQHQHQHQHQHHAATAQPRPAVSDTAVQSGSEDAHGADGAVHDHASMARDHSPTPVRHGAMTHDRAAASPDHAAMAHGQHAGHGGAAGLPQPRQPIPILTDADRAAAFPDLPGHTTHDRRVFSFLQIDRLEAWDTGSDTALAWEAEGWTGNDEHRVWLRSEGEHEHGALRGDVELMYGHPVAPWWDLLAGVRQSAGDGAPSTEAAVGVIGVAPQKFEVAATVYLGAGGRSGARVEGEYEALLTNRLILQPRVELELHDRNDRTRGTGAGLGRVEAGFRLRYEITRRVAPYVGLVHERHYGTTARFRVEDGEPVRDTRVVMGVRLRF